MYSNMWVTSILWNGSQSGGRILYYIFDFIRIDEEIAIYSRDGLSLGAPVNSVCWRGQRPAGRTDKTQTEIENVFCSEPFI